MIETFEKRYGRELAALRSLFGRNRVEQALPRVKEIHKYTEAKWREYAAALRDGTVQYLLIAEAPPWSSDGTPQYLLDPACRVRTLMRALRTAFPGAEVGSPADSLEVLANRGFLLLDSVPFAMDPTLFMNPTGCPCGRLYWCVI